MSVPCLFNDQGVTRDIRMHVGFVLTLLHLITASQEGVTLTPDLSYIEDKTKLVTQIDPGEILAGMQQAYILNSNEDVILSLAGNMYAIFVDGVPLEYKPVKIAIQLQ